MTTVGEVIRAVLGSPSKGTPARAWVKMTPTRYGHLVELLRKGVRPELVRAAEQRINASSWLKKPVGEVTDEDIEGLAQSRPWELKETVMTGEEITALMRRHQVTIKALAERLGTTMKRVREVREAGLADPNTVRDWVQAITGQDPGASGASEAAPKRGPEPMPSAGRVTRAPAHDLRGGMVVEEWPNRLGWNVGPHEVMKGEGPLAGLLSVTLDADGERRSLVVEGAADAAEAVAVALATAGAESGPAAEQAPAPPADPGALVARPLLLLHPNLGVLSRLCATAEHARFGATAGVQLRSTGRGYRAVATTGRVLGLVEGELPDDPGHYPALPALRAAPGAEAECVLPADAWARAFRAIPRKAARVKPILGNLAVAVGKDASTLASTDLDGDNVLQPRHLEGRFPDVDRVLPRGEPKAQFRVNAKLLAELLQAAAAFAGDSAAVAVEVHDSERLVAVRARCEGQQFTGLIVPLAKG